MNILLCQNAFFRDDLRKMPLRILFKTKCAVYYSYCCFLYRVLLTVTIINIASAQWRYEERIKNLFKENFADRQNTAAAVSEVMQN